MPRITLFIVVQSQCSSVHPLSATALWIRDRPLHVPVEALKGIDKSSAGIQGNAMLPHLVSEGVTEDLFYCSML